MRSFPHALLALGWTALALEPAFGFSILAHPSGWTQDDKAKLNSAVECIQEDEIERIITYLASPRLEGRDSPSAGLSDALEFVAREFASIKVSPPPGSSRRWMDVMGDSEPPEPRTDSTDSGTYYWPYKAREFRNRVLTEPDVDLCRFEFVSGEKTSSLSVGTDFVPILGCAGSAEGPIVFAGFGMKRKEDRYDDFRSKDFKGKIAVVFDGEPRHSKRFEGPEVTEEASLWTKLGELGDRGVRGVIVIRRPTFTNSLFPKLDPLPLSYRATYASWNGGPRDRRPRELPPAIEVSMRVASELLGEDAASLAESVDRAARPSKFQSDGVMVKLNSATRETPQTLFNALGWIQGKDPTKSNEVLVIGAHIDHIGTGSRGRVACGADDNASGIAALLLVARAAVEAELPRSVLVCAFSAEEDGLVGARAFCAEPLIEMKSIVAMLNMDMIGRGPRREAVALGVEQNPSMNRVLDRALSLRTTGLRKVVRCTDKGLFQLSDHFAFHEVNVPTLFLIEDFPISRNEDYHTWRDTVDRVDMVKVTATAKLAFNVLWILANEESTPPRPK